MALTWELPEAAVGKLADYPAYLTFLEAPAGCPGRKAQCFAYIRLWK